MDEWEMLSEYDRTPFDEEEEFGDEEHILESPRRIYEYLRSKVYKQDEACKAAAIILYNHLQGITSRNLFCGPAGSGKTYIWEIIKEELYPFVIICDSSTMTKTGWSGDNKVSSPLYQINPSVRNGYIIVYDEFDKLCKPHYSYNENVSACIQSELLTLIQSSNARYCIKDSKDKERHILINNISWIFTGSFAEAADNEAKKSYSSGLGFNSVKSDIKAFEKELTLQNVIDFGVIPEVASRITRIVNLRPLMAEDFEFLLFKHANSPIKRIEKLYDMSEGFIRKKIIKSKDLHEIAVEAHASGLGVRSATTAIQRRLDDYLFEHFDDMYNIH